MVIQKYKLSSYDDTKSLFGENDSHLEPILFREKLYVYDENGKRIGRFSLNIDQESEFYREKTGTTFIHISNRVIINGRHSETIVTGTVTQKLKTLEEIRYECTEVPESGKHERCMFLLRERTKYHVSVTNTVGDLKTQSHSTIPFCEALGLVGESANAILLRKLATKGYEGILSLKTVLSNGKRCENYYVTKLSQLMVNGKKTQVLIVYRNISNNKKCNVTMTLALTRAGQIIYLFWSNSKCFLHIDPDCEINTHKVFLGEPGLHNYWHKDIQLYSLYLDRVDLMLNFYKSYEYQREELRRILADFVEFLLLSKPNDVICFAIQYFSAFGHNSMRKCSSKTMNTESNYDEFYNYGEYEREGSSISLWQGEGGYYFCQP